MAKHSCQPLQRATTAQPGEGVNEVPTGGGEPAPDGGQPRRELAQFAERNMKAGEPACANARQPGEQGAQHRARPRSPTAKIDIADGRLHARPGTARRVENGGPVHKIGRSSGERADDKGERVRRQHQQRPAQQHHAGGGISEDIGHRNGHESHS